MRENFKLYERNCVKCGKVLEVGRLNMGDYVGGLHLGNDEWECVEGHKSE